MQTTPVNADPTWNTYAFQLFGNLSPVPQACQNAGHLGTNAVVFDSTNPSGSDCAQIGPDLSQAPATPTTLTTNSKGLLFAFSYTDSGTGANTLLLQLTCGEGKGTPGPVTAVDQSTGWQYSSTWPSSAACKPGQRPGDDFLADVEGAGVFGTLVLVLFFVGGAMYAGGGWYYNHRTKGYAGTEALPHIEFWRTVPGLVKDGVQYSKALVNAKIKGEAMPEGGASSTTQDAEPTEEPGTAAPGGTSKKGKKGKKPKTANKLKYAKVPDETEDEAKE